MKVWYIKLHRSSEDNVLYFSEPFTKRQARSDLLMTTAFKDWAITVRWNIIEVKRWQNWYSEDSLASRRKRSRGKVRRFLNYLETIQQIEQHKSKVKSTITIINYDKYQWNDTTDSTTDGQQTDTIKKYKKEKEIKEYISIANNSKTYCWKEQEGIAENSKTPIAENSKHNNTNNNSINNNSLSKKSLHDDKIKDKLLNDWIRFEEFWKKYPRGTSNWVTKKIVLEYYKRANEDEDEIIYQIKIINWMVDLWLQEEKYTKSCNNWVIWYKPEPQVIIQQKIKNIVYKIREKNLDKDEDIATRLINDFGKDVIMKYSREYHNEYKWVKIKLS